MKLKIENYTHDKNMKFKDFIELLLKDLNIYKNTLYITGELQCYKGKHRSLGDIHAVASYYYEGVTREQVKECLLSFGPRLVGHYCCDIDKRVYELTGSANGTRFNNWKQGSVDTKDEYGNIIYYNKEETEFELVM